MSSPSSYLPSMLHDSPHTYQLALKAFAPRVLASNFEGYPSTGVFAVCILLNGVV